MQEDKNEIFQMRFPQKLWYLLNLRTDAILWGGTGRTILLNYRILHTYLQCDHSIFKTTNISSFVRQLNLYGFRKVTSHLQDPLCNSSNPYMHEYVHDNFQYGRPELLNKITRKALAMRKCFKPKSPFLNGEPSLFLTPLQKARRNFRMALKKVAQGSFLQNSSNQMNNNFEYEDTPDDFCEEEDKDVEFEWFLSKDINQTTHHQPVEPIPPITAEVPTIIQKDAGKEPSPQTPRENIVNFMEDSTPSTNDNFANQFLSMPELDAEPSEETEVDLLAEFNINNEIDINIARKDSKEIDHVSLNCVLPSISNDHDDVGLAEDDNSDHYHEEWDQMLNDIISTKETQEGSDLKNLYSQISRTIDLLNS